MKKIKKKLSKFITVITAAAMAMSLFASTAFASDGEAYSVTVSEMTAGTSYSAQVSYSTTEDANTYALSSTAVTMITNYFGSEIEIVPLEDSTYNIIISFGGTTGYSSAITGIYYYADSDFSNDDGAVLSSASAEDETAAFTVNVSSIESDIYLSVVISGAMAGMFSPGADIVMSIDTSSITTEYVQEDDGSEDDAGDGAENDTEDALLEQARAAAEEAVSIYSGLLSFMYTGESWSAYEEAVAALEELLADENASSSEIAAATEAVLSAYEDLSDADISGQLPEDDGSSDGLSDDDSSDDENGDNTDGNAGSGGDSSDEGDGNDTGNDGSSQGDSSDAESGDDSADNDSSGSLSPAAGTYDIDAQLSAYVSAMGGIEFGFGLLDGAQLVVDSEGNCYITLYFTTSEISVYGSALDTFVDASESAPGCYDSDGTVVAAAYTLSSETALNPDGEEVNYVDSMTFAVSADTSSYYLWIYINSSFMGVQFCDGSGTGSSNTPGTATPYAAVLTIDWESAVLISSDFDESLSDEVSAAEEEIEVSGSGSSDSSGSSSDSDSSDASSDTEDDDEVPYGLEAGTYYPDASLSAYISAMGGIEFGSDLLSGVKVVVNGDGTYTITVYFTTASVSIYSVSVETFIDASDSVPGYYDSDGNLVYASYTLSSGTAADANGNSVNYVDSMTFTVSELQSAYYLYIYVNSSVMGVQFCSGKGTGSSNTPGVETPYAALLTIDWSSIGADVSSSPQTGQEFYPGAWMLLFAAAALGITMLSVRRKSD